MKRIFLFATIVAMSFAIIPANAQSRKEKKAAQKEAWEQEQKQQREEDELRHKMRMDSIANAQKRAQEEAQRAAIEQTSEMPCQYYDDADWFYATGVKRFKANQRNLTPTTLLRSTRQQLLQKLAGKYKAVVDDYFDQMEKEEGEYARQHIESAGRQVINQLINETYEVCRKQTQIPDSEGFYTMYMAIKISKKEVVEKSINSIKNDEEMRVRFNEKKFRDSVFKEFEESNEKAYNEFKQQ